VIALSDVNSVIVERYSYDVFGQSSNTSDVNNPYLFTGRRYDDETGLYYYRARYYDYATGRFMQTDPVGYSAGLNLYAYCGNNPGNFVDPLGLFLLDSDVYYSGLTVIANEGLSGQVQIAVVADTSGNIGLLFTESGGGGLLGAGIADVFGALKATENLNRPLTNFDLAQGDSQLAGVSYGIGEEEVIGENYKGYEYNFGPISPDIHGHTSVNTAYLHVFNYNTDIYDPLHSFGYDLGVLEQAMKKKITDSLISNAKNIGNNLQQLAEGLKNKLSDLGKKMLQPFKDMFGPKKE
jgi:RHS repeat-associated protein